MFLDLESDFIFSYKLYVELQFFPPYIMWLYYFSKASITEHHKPGGLKQQKFYFPHSSGKTKSEISCWLPLKEGKDSLGKEPFSLLFLSFCWLLTIFDVPWLVIGGSLVASASVPITRMALFPGLFEFASSSPLCCIDTSHWAGSSRISSDLITSAKIPISR